MKRSGLLIIFSVLGLGWALASGCASHPIPVTEKPEITLRRAYPNLPFESIEQTEINGLYEVISGLNVLLLSGKRVPDLRRDIYHVRQEHHG